MSAFAVALFVTAEVWKQFRCLQIENWLHRLWSTLQWNTMQLWHRMVILSRHSFGKNLQEKKMLQKGSSTVCYYLFFWKVVEWIVICIHSCFYLHKDILNSYTGNEWKWLWGDSGMGKTFSLCSFIMGMENHHCLGWWCYICSWKIDLGCWGQLSGSPLPPLPGQDVDGWEEGGLSGTALWKGF